jgi:hypothetical protein
VLSGCTPPAATPDTGEGTSSGNSESENPTITIEISPETLAGLSGPEQIAEALAVSTTSEDGMPLTAGEYVVEFAHSLEGLLNSGTTEAEYELYEGTGNNLYENAMHDKYDAAGLGALFVAPSDAAWIGENHKGNVLMSGTARVLEVEEFRQNVDIALADAANQDAPAAGAEMNIEITYTSNADEIGLVDFYDGTAQETAGLDRSARYSLRVSDDGMGHLKAQLTLIPD